MGHKKPIDLDENQPFAETLPVLMRYWWVNHKQTFRHEFEGRYIWSPKRKRDGSRNRFYSKPLGSWLDIRHKDYRITPPTPGAACIATIIIHHIEE